MPLPSWKLAILLDSLRFGGGVRLGGVEGAGGGILAVTMRVAVTTGAGGVEAPGGGTAMLAGGGAAAAGGGD